MAETIQPSEGAMAVARRICGHGIPLTRALDVAALIDREAVTPAVRILVEALTFYADNWEGHSGDSGPGGNWPADPETWPNESLAEDAGEIARLTVAHYRYLLESLDAGKEGGDV